MRDLGAVTLVKGFAPSLLRTFFGKSRIACFYNCGSSVSLRLGFLAESKSEDSKIAAGIPAAHIRARGGIGRHDGFRFHCASVQVQVLSGAPAIGLHFVIKMQADCYHCCICIFSITSSSISCSNRWISFCKVKQWASRTGFLNAHCFCSCVTFFSSAVYCSRSFSA